ncbi:MAG: DUF5611 family protein [Thermoplasmataceae archaeon]
MVREYPVKKGFKSDLETIYSVAKEVVGKAEISGETVITSIPGLRKIEIRPGKSSVLVETEPDSASPDPLRTVHTFNELIEKITGFSAKERKKKMTKI